MDAAQDANGLPNAAAIAAWAAGSPTTKRTWYEQQNARHATQTTLAQQPVFDADGARGQIAAYNSFKAAMFDGWLDVPGGNVRKPKRLVMPASVTFELQNHTIFLVIDPKSALYNDIYYGLTPSAGGNSITAVGTATALPGVYASNSPSNTVGNRRARQNYQTIAFASGVSSFKFHQDGAVFTASNNKWQQTVIGGVIGDDSPGSGDFLSGDNFLAVVIYPTQLSDANVALVKAALDATFGLVTTTDVVCVSVGDSIEYGPTYNESLEGRTLTRCVRPLLKRDVSLYNMGLSSTTLADVTANSATREFLLIAASTGYTKRILRIEIGTNSIGTGSKTGAQLYSDMGTYHSNARAAGATHTVIHTLLPRGGSYAAEINAYNALVRANSIGVDAIADVAAHPIMGDQANVPNLLYYQDSLHPTGYGNSLIAPIIAAAINSVL